MKRLIIVIDGVADYPIKSLGGKTPLMQAHTPHMDQLAKEGVTGKFITVPEGLLPGSEVANLSIMGYCPVENFCQRGVLEAASLGVELSDHQVAMRCNLVYIKDQKMCNHSGGDLEHEDAKQFICALNQKLGNDRFHFYQGVHYRHLLVVDRGDSHITCWPPHDHLGKTLEQLQITANTKEAQETADALNKLILDSQAVLQNVPYNQNISSELKHPNYIWPWAAGEKPKMQPIAELTGLRGAVITAVDLIKGLGIYAGMKVIPVEGATGNYQTNYENKATAAIKALNDYDYVFLHVEAADEASHDGDLDLKIKVINDLDSRLLANIMKEVKSQNLDVSIALLPDHPTPVELRCHVSDPVPLVIWGGARSDQVVEYSEESTKQGALGTIDQKTFFNYFFID
ncbi:MAG: cofactor-independent phosphoglycerate mutase [Bacteriovoracaceae bacterium]|nr:cofactor-independent phosphoglycerate mutase [Bacteriovoracaceae bacterium]